MQEIYEILSELGYQLKDFGQTWRTAAIYREGKNVSSLIINKDDGSFMDFGTGKSGSLKNLLQLTSGSLKESEIDEKLAQIKFQVAEKAPKQKIKKSIIYSADCLERLLPHWDFYLNTGISKETLSTFQMGLAQSGKLNHRYCFPIYNKNNQIEGFAGRWYKKVPPYSVVKWKIMGQKAHFIFPQHLQKDVNFDTVILVESIGCTLRLFNAGFKNVFCLFGTSISSKLMLHLIGLSPKKIIVSLNKDGEEKNFIGEKAGENIRKKLVKFFDEKKVVIKLPTKNDFGDMTNEETIKWYQEIK